MSLSYPVSIMFPIISYLYSILCTKRTLIVRRFTRERHERSNLSDYICSSLSNIHTKSSSSYINYLISNFHSYYSFICCPTNFLYVSKTVVEPQSYEDSCKYPFLNEAMERELDPLRRNETWQIVEFTF